LAALAEVADAAPGETICAALDARKREVYAALFEATSAAPRRITDDLALRPDALAARLAPPCVLGGDAGDGYGDVVRTRPRDAPEDRAVRDAPSARRCDRAPRVRAARGGRGRERRHARARLRSSTRRRAAAVALTARFPAY